MATTRGAHILAPPPATQVLTPSTSLVWDVLGLKPAARPAFYAELGRERFARLLACARRDLGTPYGLWADDPVGFWRQILGFQPWLTQELIGDSVEANQRTVVPSCHGAGKTISAAMVVAWFGSVHPAADTQIITTAPRMRQVRTLLWPHIRRVHAATNLPGETDMTQWKVDDYLLAYGFSAANASEDAVQGIHAPHLLIVIDEAGGINPTLGKGIESITTGAHTRVLAIGNPPTEDEGSWFEERTQSELWHSIRIPWDETPNHPDYAGPPVSPTVAAGLIDQRWVDEQIIEFGEDSAFVEARVWARFPHGTTDRTIPWSWVEGAMENDEPEESTWIRLGIDSASDGGDEFAIAQAVGNVVSIVHASSGPQNANPTDVAGKALDHIRAAEELRVKLGEKRPVRVKVDSIGVGWAVYGLLEAWRKEGVHHAEIVECDVSERANDSDKFANKRAEMWWAGREAFRPRTGVEGRPSAPPVVRLDLDGNKRAAAQLTTPKYGHDTRGRIKIERKVDIKRRSLGSPDRAEAILLAIYEPRPHTQGKSYGRQLTSAQV